jgi:tRNA threonylcarbamoyladenosine biosynthesis protein TsaB
MKLLALDTSTETQSIAVTRPQDGVARVWQYTGPGGARASHSLIANAMDLMAQAGLALQDLDAIAFGCGPGAFTGLRTACAVAQGLAFGAGVPVLPVGSLLTLAQAARTTHLGAAWHGHIVAVLDARMDEVYSAALCVDSAGIWHTVHATALVAVHDFAQTLASAPGVFAGNVWAAYPHLFAANPEAHTVDTAAAHPSAAPPAQQRISAVPTAVAMLQLAPQLLASGQAVAAEHALPVYVRNKVAQTTAERLALKAAP